MRLGSRPLLSRSSVPRLSPQKQGSAHVTGRAGKCIDLKPTSAEAGASGHLWDQEGSGLRPARPGQGGEAGKGDAEKAREPEARSRGRRWLPPAEMGWSPNKGLTNETSWHSRQYFLVSSFIF